MRRVFCDSSWGGKSISIQRNFWDIPCCRMTSIWAECRLMQTQLSYGDLQFIIIHFFFFAWALRFLLEAHIIINQRLWGRTQWIAESDNSWYETGYPASTPEKKPMRIQWPPPEECQTFSFKKWQDMMVKLAGHCPPLLDHIYTKMDGQ